MNVHLHILIRERPAMGLSLTWLLTPMSSEMNKEGSVAHWSTRAFLFIVPNTHLIAFLQRVTFLGTEKSAIFPVTFALRCQECPGDVQGNAECVPPPPPGPLGSPALSLSSWSWGKFCCTLNATTPKQTLLSWFDSAPSNSPTWNWRAYASSEVLMSTTGVLSRGPVKQDRI